MGADHRAQVDELIADYRRSRDQLADVHRALGALAKSATSPCGSVTATVSAHGAVVGIDFRDDAYRLHRPDALARVVLDTIAAAAALAARAADEVMAPVLPAGTDPAALRRGLADLTPGEVAPPVEEFDFERATWLQSDGGAR
ncbi:YbaB/EbfC family nucleoid-associated protein [Actinokineospora soli]|uniref:YbaB/EbfC family nucleoid-associated protein n=1 Tax=Actinokineospora soli TaxID=1048753 RepID=A0ABW2TV76_9PSEU